MSRIRKEHLLAVNGLLWTAVGIKITTTGIQHYLTLPSVRVLLWMIPLSLLVFAGFYLMFTGVIRKYSARILSLEGERQSILRTFSLKGYILIAFMISLGITLRHIPAVPRSFIGWFYCGLGPGLISAGVRFIIKWHRSVTTK